MNDYSDVLIIGAGFSGIGAAYRIHDRCRRPLCDFGVMGHAQQD